MKAWMSSYFGRIPPLTSELAALERLKKQHNLVSTLAPSFLAHLSQRLIGELIVYRSSLRPCVCASVRVCVR